jgi:hypothetical protein
MTDLTPPAQPTSQPEPAASQTGDCTLHALVTQHAEALSRQTESTLPGTGRGAQELQAVRLRCAELEADLAAQRVYSGRALADAWTVIYRMRTERAQVERWQADRQNFLEDRETEKRNWEADRQALLEAYETDKQELLRGCQSGKQLLEQRIASLTTSTSWRMTAPMRMAGGQIRTLLAMLRRKH